MDCKYGIDIPFPDDHAERAQEQPERP